MRRASCRRSRSDHHRAPRAGSETSRRPRFIWVTAESSSASSCPNRRRPRLIVGTCSVGSARTIVAANATGSPTCCTIRLKIMDPAGRTSDRRTVPADRDADPVLGGEPRPRGSGHRVPRRRPALTSNTALLVDAALSDLLTRLENRVDDPDEEGTLFDPHQGRRTRVLRPPPGRRPCALLACPRVAARSRSPSSTARRRSFEKAYDVATDAQSMRSSVAVVDGARRACVATTSPRWGLDPNRPERAGGDPVWLDRAMQLDTAMVPEAAYARGILAYEENDFARAIELLRRRAGTTASGRMGGTTP